MNHLGSILLTLAVVCSDAASTARDRRQLATDRDDRGSYLEPAAYINPLTESPSQFVHNTEPIQPAPQIEPAPVILPSNAITENGRSSTMSKRQRINSSNHPRQAVPEVLVIEHQMASSKIQKFPPQPTKPNKNTTNQRKPLPTTTSFRQTYNKTLPLHDHRHTSNNKNLGAQELAGIEVIHRHKNGRHNRTKNLHFRKIMHDGKPSEPRKSQDKSKVSFKFKLQIKDGMNIKKKETGILNGARLSHRAKYPSRKENNFKPVKQVDLETKKYSKRTKIRRQVIGNSAARAVSRNFRNRNDYLLTEKPQMVTATVRWPKLLRKQVPKVTATRYKRQLLPFNIGDQPTMDTLQQQLVPGLQQDLPDQQQVLGGMITGQTGESLLPGESILRPRQEIISPFLSQEAQPIPVQQSPVLQPVIPVQQPLLLSPVQQSTSNQFESLPVMSTIPYQNLALAPQYVQTEPQSTTGRSRHTIPEAYHEYTLDDEYANPHPRHHRPRHRARYRPYDAYRSFEYTYGKSPGIFDDLKDISNQMNLFDDNNYSPNQVQNDWSDDSYDEHAHRYYHRRHHPKPQHSSEYKEFDTGDEAPPQRKTGYTSGETPGISINSDDSLERELGGTTDSREMETLHDGDYSSENTANKPKTQKEVKAIPAAQMYADEYESEEAIVKRKQRIKHLDKDAIMHLDFDEFSDKRGVVKDSSGNGNDASLMDGAVITTKTLGTCGHGAILKKGEISYKGMFFQRKPTKAVSIAMWVKSKNPGFIRWFDEDSSPDKGFFASTKSASVGKNRWTHLAGTFDTKTGIARIYVNGRLKVEKAGKKNSGLPQDFTSTGIGRKFGDNHVSFLDDVYMFDRVLSAEEVRDLYKKCQFNRMILHFGFQHWNGTTEILRDQSGLQNNATLKGGAKVRPKADCDKCGACLDLESNDESQVYLNSTKYRQKPTSAVSISAWVNLNRTKGLHSIFQAINDQTSNNLYNLEVVDGKIHWQSKDKNGDIIFDALTNEVTIPEGLWSHVTGTYNSRTGNAKIYVNGLLRASFHNPEGPELSTSWNKASIGGHFPEDKPFSGLLDEFFMYNWELDASEIQFVSKYCADKPKLVSFTVKVPIL